ncbi:MAG: two-component regulator propeller domain-containing protein [Bacteroidota bacterium]
MIRFSLTTRYFLWFLFSLSQLGLQAQQSLRFRYFDKQDGLSQNTIFAITQDGDGFMWFGSRNGLNRFDGYNFKQYHTQADENQGLVDNDIRSLYYDKLDSSLWIGTRNGLGKFYLSEERFANFGPDSLPAWGLGQEFIRNIQRDSKGRLWIAMASGFTFWDESHSRFAPIIKLPPSEAEVSSSRVSAFIEDAVNRLWLGGANGLYLIENAQSLEPNLRAGEEVYPILSALNNTDIRSLCKDHLGNIWIGTHHSGLYRWQPQNNQLALFLHEPGNINSLADNSVRTIVMDREQQIWIGTFAGLNRYRAKEGDFETIKSEAFMLTGLSNSSIHKLFVSKKGALWLGTYNGGVNYLDESFNRFDIYRRQPYPNSLSNDVISSFAETPEGNLWIGTEGGGLNYFDRQAGKFQQFKPRAEGQEGISGLNIKSLLLDGDSLWVGTYQFGLNLVDLRTKRVKQFQREADNPKSLGENNVYSILREGPYLWLAVYSGGIDRLDLRTGDISHLKSDPNNVHSLPNNDVRVLHKDRQGDIWAGTEKGLCLMQGREPETLSFQQFLPQVKVYSLRATDSLGIWIGTFNHGLYYLNKADGSFKHYTTEDGLTGNSVFGILKDDDGYIWLSTNNGIARFSPVRETFSSYSYTNGLEELEFNFNAYAKTRKGELLFGSTDGFTLFSPEDISLNTFVPPIVFTGLQVQNQNVEAKPNGLLAHSINHTETLRFGYKEANFTLQFSALDYSNPQGNQYAYKMDGIDNDWQYRVGQQSATYTIQKEGEYVFHVKGANNEGIWNPVERQIRIVVSPPPWRTWWAYLLYIVSLSLLTFAIIRFVRLRHSYQLEKITKQKQEEAYQTKLRFFTNITHEFRTPLTLIIGPLQDLIATQELSAKVQKQLYAVERNAQRLLSLVNQLLDFRKLEAEHRQVEAAQGNFVRFLREVYLSFLGLAQRQDISYQFDTEAEEYLLWYDRDKMEKVFYNLLSNAFKFTPRGGQISVIIRRKGNNLEVKIKDTGPGIAPDLHEQIFERFFERSAKQQNTDGIGIGLAYTRQLLELHSAQIEIQSDGKTGSTFLVRIPMGKAHFDPMDLLNDFRNSEDSSHYPTLTPAPLKGSKAQTTSEATILVVEDNPEVRAYIEQIFAGEYRLLLAENGVEGYTLAREQLPDLIISDVMMPKMDGISFCTQIKTDLNTSHIPVLLLTARTAMIFRIEGLETGADDFITKPFSSQELRLKVRNQLKVRHLLWDRFARTRDFNPKEVSVTTADERFLSNLMDTCEKQLGNPDFNMESFADELAVSRPLLFSKVKALTGQTPNNFLKSIRLKRAVQLLEKGGLGISEIAYLVGFRDPRYFSKVFQKEHRMTPSEYARTHSEKQKGLSTESQ